MMIIFEYVPIHLQTIIGHCSRYVYPYNCVHVQASLSMTLTMAYIFKEL